MSCASLFPKVSTCKTACDLYDASVSSVFFFFFSFFETMPAKHVSARCSFGPADDGGGPLKFPNKFSNAVYPWVGDPVNFVYSVKPLGRGLKRGGGN